MTFTWFGRQMKTAEVGSTTILYKYNADGLRTKKIIDDTTTHVYEYTGNTLYYENRGGMELHYRYDVNGNLASITRIKADGTKFTLYAICNSRGDVDELRTLAGEQYARYVYDTWGNTIHIYDADGNEITSTANLAVQNPIRYRGYYFDSETGLYYVGSRYYDPVTCRFVNADTTDVLAATPMGLTDKNLFAYCDNNPVTRADNSGQAWHIVAGAVIGGLFELAGQLLAREKINWAKVGIATLSGGITAVAGPLAGAAISGLTNMALDALSGDKDPVSLIVSGAIGAGSSLVGTGVGKVVEKIGGKLATKALSNMSKTKLKSIVTGLDSTIKGVKRNAIKSMSYLTINHKDIGSRYFMSTHLGKTISTSMGQIAEGVSSLGANHSIKRCIPLW